MFPFISINILLRSNILTFFDKFNRKNTQSVTATQKAVTDLSACNEGILNLNFFFSAGGGKTLLWKEKISSPTEVECVAVSGTLVSKGHKPIPSSKTLQNVEKIPPTRKKILQSQTSESRSHPVVIRWGYIQYLSVSLPQSDSIQHNVVFSLNIERMAQEEDIEEKKKKKMNLNCETDL
ncbi:hypothetical protein PGB90_003602 [Kerria lacca]